MNRIIILIKTIKNKILNYLKKRYMFNKLFKANVIIHSSVVLYGEPIINKASGSKIIIHENVVLCSEASKNDIGVNHPIILTTKSENAIILIGKNTGISGASIAAMYKIEIGENCLIGANVIIADNDFHPVNPINRRFSNINIGCKEVIIMNNVFIGANSIVLKGVTIGENSVIGAGSVVTRDVEANSVYGGNPCKKIKSIDFI